VPRVAGSAEVEDGRIVERSWEAAQAWCNFVLFRPGSLPAGAEVRAPTLRPEAPPGRGNGDHSQRAPWTATNRASHRCTIAWPEARVRVKQFLYDWAPPAFDHPSLWKSEVRPFVAGERIGWLGVDYRGCAAASLHVHRTMIEVAVERGAATDEDLIAICRGLRCVSRSACERIDATPLAALAYAHRHPDPIIDVPVGYYRHRRDAAHALLHAFVPRAPSDVPPHLPGARIAARLAARYPVDSVFRIGERRARLGVDWVFRRAGDADTTLRLLATEDRVARPVAWPPEREPQPGRTETVAVGGVAVHHAWADERYGPHEAVWADAGETLVLLARPRTDANATWFRGLLDATLAG